MTCQECQRAMLIHDILDADEHHQIELHKNDCPSCQAFWHEIAQVNAVVKKASSQKNEARNFGALADRVMTAVIRAQEPKKIPGWFESFFLDGYTRFMLSGVSVVLIFFFCTEVTSNTIVQKPVGPVAGLQVILKSQDFRKSFSVPKPEKKMLMGCLDANHKLNLACMKSKMKF